MQSKPVDELEPLFKLIEMVSPNGLLSRQPGQLNVQPTRAAAPKFNIKRNVPNMPSELLPTFKYHLDPLATGSIVSSSNECVVCGRERGYIYCGPVYAEEDYDSCICPWCIADGSAHDKLGVTFHDDASVPGGSFPDVSDVSPEIVSEVCQRTPGFGGWQQEQWFTCCDDAGVFLGQAGRKELESKWPEAIPKLRESTGLKGDAWQELLKALDRDHGPTAYVFRCRHCQAFGAYQDTN
ncbi:hypothetical protein SAMN05519104_0498 [Rhizobiales bacterium GAS188]|nr:hypothetical protein SAMN05519104_0495 [Rhizobiales bacterium GAS188]SEB97718.1 hypothetical protein SAMN05519104_0498 [Rhizobiales bacterium GAS188]